MHTITRFSGRQATSLLAAFAAVILLATGFTVAGPNVGTASAAPCGANKYVESIKVEKIAGPDFKIVLRPTTLARIQGMSQVARREATVSMWHQIQGCVPGLYGSLADSIWQQLDCHEMFAVEKIGVGGAYKDVTGPTFDFESWRLPLDHPNPASYIATHCLNEVNKGEAGLGNNFPGYLDLEAPNNVG